MNITNHIAKHKELLWFTMLSYIDKAIAFVLPLLVLYIGKDKACYNTIEYIYSIAIIVVTPYGLHSGAFFYYEAADDKRHYLAVYRHATSLMLFVMLFTALVGMVIWNLIDSKTTLVIGLCVCMRMAYLLFLNHESAYYRLVDKAPRVLEISILIGLASFILVLIAFSLNVNLLIPFFIVGLIVPIVFCLRTIAKGGNVAVADVWTFFKQSYSYSWLLMLNYLLGVFIANFCKLYGYNYLSTDDMYVLSYTLRISLIMQLAHMSICSYYSKQLYEKGYTPKFIIVYLAYILFSCLGCLLFMVLQNAFSDITVPLSVSTYIIMAYVIVYYSASLLEIFFNRRGRNANILILTVISTAVFISILYGISEMSLLNISIAMLVFAATRFTLYAVRIYQIKRQQRIINDQE